MEHTVGGKHEQCAADIYKQFKLASSVIHA